ncbi:hypothetical protein [Cohnella cholangitidis]|uniref:Uncharacterized protein n=1 Tax=Cohnella cholangitidis TaxID=2598458 RepID=A0A7G5BXJ1_9BACL|nr:hypothetical protein [Cohnella cholangitidis]QMV41675.1 hypothetical protein FPL14_11140 [Cohnella cholangitidis]
MEASDLASRVSKWKMGYEQLAKISLEQLTLIKSMDPGDELWNRIQLLTEEKSVTQGQMESIQNSLKSDLGIEEMKRLFQREIQTAAETARVLTFEAAHKIETMMVSTGTELGSTKTHRKVFNAYSGMNSDDQISYYFDEKK